MPPALEAGRGLRVTYRSNRGQIHELLSSARGAQAIFELFSQEQVDSIVKGIGKYVYDNAEPLARMAVDETGIGGNSISENLGYNHLMNVSRIGKVITGKRSRQTLEPGPDLGLTALAVLALTSDRYGCIPGVVEGPDGAPANRTKDGFFPTACTHCQALLAG